MNDVTVLGGGVQGFFDYSTMTLKRVTMGNTGEGKNA